MTRSFGGAAANGALQPGDLITATGTDAEDNTSEYSVTIQIPGTVTTQIPGTATATSSSAGARSSIDVNADGGVSAVDALMVINSLNDSAEGESRSVLSDVNGDGQVTALDALQVINYLNEQSNYDPIQESNHFASLVDQAMDDVVEELEWLESALF